MLEPPGRKSWSADPPACGSGGSGADVMPRIYPAAPESKPAEAAPAEAGAARYEDRYGRGQRQTGCPAGSSTIVHLPSPGWKSGTVAPMAVASLTAVGTSST